MAAADWSMYIVHLYTDIAYSTVNCTYIAYTTLGHVVWNFDQSFYGKLNDMVGYFSVKTC